MLRRYLEQRRELGESELVLDGLHVEDVMRLLGAAGGHSLTEQLERGPRTERPPSNREAAAVATSEDGADWRTTLREAGVNVDAREGAQSAAEAEEVAEPPSQPP